MQEMPHFPQASPKLTNFRRPAALEPTAPTGSRGIVSRNCRRWN